MARAHATLWIPPFGRLGLGTCARAGLLACAALVLGACEADDKAVLPQVNYEAFVADAYPVLMRDCAFPACHGTSERLFQVYGPGRARLPEEDGDYPSLYEPATQIELEVSFARSRSMLLHRGDLAMAPLLRKPVQGSAHFGLDRWQRNIYRNAKVQGYLALKAWAEGAGPQPKKDESDQEKAARRPASSASK